MEPAKQPEALQQSRQERTPVDSDIYSNRVPPFSLSVDGANPSQYSLTVYLYIHTMPRQRCAIL